MPRAGEIPKTETQNQSTISVKDPSYTLPKMCTKCDQEIQYCQLIKMCAKYFK